jgi:hypothetical protein
MDGEKCFYQKENGKQREALPAGGGGEGSNKQIKHETWVCFNPCQSTSYLFIYLLFIPFKRDMVLAFEKDKVPEQMLTRAAVSKNV